MRISMFNMHRRAKPRPERGAGTRRELPHSAGAVNSMHSYPMKEPSKGREMIRGKLVLAPLVGGTVMAILAASCVVLSGAASAAPLAAKSKKCTITVGSPLPITGTLSFYGTNYQRGFNLAVKKINATGGIAGCRIAVKYTDTQGDLAQSLAAVRSYHAQGIKFIIGTSSSTTDGPDSALADKLGMGAWVLGVDTTITTRGLKLVVDPAVWTPNFIKPVFAELSNIQKQVGKPLTQISVALVHSNDAYGTTTAKAETKELKRLKARIVGTFPYTIASTNLTPTVLAVQKANPTVVMQTGYTTDIVTMWTDAKAVGYAPPYFIGAGGTASTNFVKALGNYSTGFIAYDYALPTPKIPASLKFAQEYRKAYGEPLPSGHALMAYSSFMMMATAMRKAHGDTPKAVTAAAHKMKAKLGTYPDGCGFKLTKGGQNIECYSNAYEWEKGKAVTIWPVSSANGHFFGPIPASKS